MELSTRAIVLRSIQHKDSSSIVTAYTRERGIMAFVLRSAGRRKATSRAVLQALSRVEISAQVREKRQLQIIKAMSPLPDGAMLMSSPVKASTALFLAEVLYRCLREEAADAQLYDFLEESIAYYAREAMQADFHLIFLMHLSRYFGFYPSGRWSPENPHFDLEGGCFIAQAEGRPRALSGDYARHFDQLIQARFGGETMTISRTERRELLHALLDYYALHMEGMGRIKSLEVLIEVFA